MKKIDCLLISGLLLVLLYYFPFLYFGADSHITIHDNLDSTIAYLNVLKENHLLFCEGDFPAMSGLRASNISFGFLPRLLLVSLFSPYTSYILNELVGRLAGFLGMYVFLKRYVLKTDMAGNGMIVMFSSLCFSLMPYYSDYGLSVMGLPLLAFSFFNLRDRRQLLLSYCFLLFVALYSSLVLSGLFAGAFLAVYYLYICHKDKDFHKEYLGGLFALALVYFATNYSLFVNFFSTVPSHRLEFVSSSSFVDICRESLGMLYITQYHTGTLPVILIVVFAIFMCLYDRKADKTLRLLSCLIMGIILFSFVYRCLLLVFPKSSFLQAFQFDRFYFLLPFFWICLLAHLVGRFISGRKSRVEWGFLYLFLFFGLVFYRNSEYRFFIKSLLGMDVTEQPSYRQFYDVELFDRIDADLSVRKHDKRIVCLGFFPSVALYNGFYTLDGYIQSYPLSYKHQFRKVIAPELAKSDELRAYFDNWGSRCYLFSSELGRDYLWGKHRGGSVTHLEIDTGQLRDLGCDYLFSAVDIEDCDSLGLEFKGAYTTPSSFWNIRVYGVR